jgi:hypothetical protein
MDLTSAEGLAATIAKKHVKAMLVEMIDQLVIVELDALAAGNPIVNLVWVSLKPSVVPALEAAIQGA